MRNYKYIVEISKENKELIGKRGLVAQKRTLFVLQICCAT